MKSDRSTVALAALVAVAMIAQQVAAKAARDAFFLTHFPATALPLVMAASAALSFVVVLGIARAMASRSPARVAPNAFLMSGILFAVEWWLSAIAPREIAVLVYLHVSALGAAVVSGFWSVLAERFDSYRAKRVIAPIAGGATLGGVLGGLAAWQGSHYVDVATLLVGLAVLNVLCGAGLLLVARGLPGPPDITTPAPSGFHVIKEVPYLQHLAMLVLLGALAEACIDYVFKANASAQYESSAELVSFFAIFHMMVGLVTLALQTLVTGPALRNMGLTGSVATLPSAAVAGGIVALLAPRLWSIVVLRGATAILENSLWRSGYELLYTPLTPARKRPTKTVIDVGFDRLGALAGSGCALLLVSLLPRQANNLLIAVAVLAALSAIMITSFLHNGYVDALADSLRSGAVRLEADQVTDSTTQRTLADTVWGGDRDQLMASLRGKSVPQPPIRQLNTLDTAPPILRTLAALSSHDEDRMRTALRNHRPLPRELVGHVIPLLGHDKVARDAADALREVAPRIVGQLVDAIRDPNTDAVVRRRIPALLGRAGDDQAIDGLLSALADERFEVRYRAAMALVQVMESAPERKLPRAYILERAEREARQGAPPVEADAWGDAGLDDEHEPLTAAPAERLGRRLTFVFALLSLVMEREPLLLAYRALTSRDPGLRGTGLEYLENVLPPTIQQALKPYLGAQAAVHWPSRPAETVVRELIHALEPMGVDVEGAKRTLEKPPRGRPEAG